MGITSSAAVTQPRSRILVHSADALLVLAALVQGGALAALPSLPTVALVVWWGSNTVAHCAVHRPLFRNRTLRWASSLYLSALLGIPQEVWRARHLAHHAGVRPRLRASPLLCLQAALVGGVWGAMAAWTPGFFLGSYLPGWLLGLLLCHIHGRMEHSCGTVSHHGRLYNWLFFNDGYHVEHHTHPGAHWTELPSLRSEGTPASRWPPVLRWLEGTPLERLERLVFGSSFLRRFVLERHERALRLLLADSPPRRVLIVGGGLFPRTAILLGRLFPAAEVTILDANAGHIETARSALGQDAARCSFTTAWFDAQRHVGFDVVVIPLSYRGDREALYFRPPAPRLLVHDWIWSPRGRSTVVSWLLLKRLNLLEGGEKPALLAAQQLV